MYFFRQQRLKTSPDSIIHVQVGHSCCVSVTDQVAVDLVAHYLKVWNEGEVDAEMWAEHIDKISITENNINIHLFTVQYFKSKHTVREWLPNLPSQEVCAQGCPTGGIWSVGSRWVQKGQTIGVSSPDEKPSYYCWLWELHPPPPGLGLEFKSTTPDHLAHQVSTLSFDQPYSSMHRSPTTATVCDTWL